MRICESDQNLTYARGLDRPILNVDEANTLEDCGLGARLNPFNDG
jgi:hypothetical protein